MATITEDEIYSIRTDILCNYFGATNDSNIKKLIAEFLSYKRKGEETSELFLQFLSRRNPEEKTIILSKLQDRETWEKENFLTAKCARSMVSQLLRWPDLIHDGPFNLNEYYFFGLEDERLSPANGVILNQSVEVDFAADREFFKSFFIFILTREEYPERFLAYHRVRTFHKDDKKYRQFLKDCLDELTVRKAFLKQWIKDELTNTSTAQSIVNNIADTNKKPAKIETIVDLFQSKEAFLEQVEILKKTDPPMLDANGKSSVKERWRSAWAAWIYVMNSRQKFNSNARRVKNEKEWAQLLKNAFEETVSDTTLRNTGATAYQKYKVQLLKLVK